MFRPSWHIWSKFALREDGDSEARHSQSRHRVASWSKFALREDGDSELEKCESIADHRSV